jgi:branched-chain amino acid transport system permease protein
VEWVNAVVQGVVLGGLYTLLAAGLSLMFGVMRIVNLAHGALAIVAAYLGVVLVDGAGLPPFATLAVVVPAMAALGYALQYGLFNTSLARGGLAPILVTFGLAVVLTNVAQEVFTADSRSIRIGSLATSSLRLTGDLSVGTFPLLTFGVGVAVIAGLQLFLFRTRTGRAMRAASDDREAAQVMGIDNRRVYAVATAIALATLGLAGVFLGMRTQFTPTSGDSTLIFAFEAVIIGGLGSLWGTLAGGVVLGVAQAVGAQLDPAFGILVGHLVFLAVLVVRPSGLLPKAVNA